VAKLSQVTIAILLFYPCGCYGRQSRRFVEQAPLTPRVLQFRSISGEIRRERTREHRMRLSEKIGTKRRTRESGVEWT
jgi:hypothetical protein